MSERPSVSVIIPVYNEKDNLPELLARTLAACRTLGRPWELILVDDGSRDGSTDLLADAARAHPGEIKSLLLNRNYGQHNAILCGFAAAQGDIMVTLDADLQNPPEEIGALCAKMDEGYDIVGSVRQDRQDALFRKVFSGVVNLMVRRTTGVKLHDYGCMLRAYRRRVVEAMLLCRERHTFIPVLANLFAKRVTEIPVAHAERSRGTSKYSVLKLINLQFDLLTCMTAAPLRLVTWVGVAISALSVGFGALLLVLRLIYGPEWAAAGVFTLFAVLFFFIGAQFIAFGLMGEYIGRIHADVRERPRYILDRVVGETLGERPGIATQAHAARSSGN
ncbi:MAG: undecaprenyl phosphate-L-Ara4FN transferase [Planctomycetota bacterium]|jgi:undecaprenyl-phosphate 4-deoxy-4-formamido-L-arabinose transferase